MQSLGQFAKHFTIGGKSIFVVEDHHHVLLPWAFLRQQFDRPPNLITVDHHTDTHEPFLHYRHFQSVNVTLPVDDAKRNAMLAPMLAEVDWRSERSIVEAISKLKNDEHISTATLTGILNWAFCINLSDSTTPSREEDAWRSNGIFNNIRQVPYPARPYTYDPPDDRIFTISSICAVDCQKRPHDDACTTIH